MIEKCQVCDTFHHAGGRVAEKLAPRLESAVDTNVVAGYHVKVARLGWVMRCLFRDIIAALPVVKVPVAGKDFAENRVEWLLGASGLC